MLKGAHPDDDDVVLCWTSARKARSFSILEEAGGALAEDHDWTDSTWLAALLPGMDLVFDASRAVCLQIWSALIGAEHVGHS